MRKTTLLTFAAGMMAGWWAARRTTEDRSAPAWPVPAPPETPVDMAPATAEARAAEPQEPPASAPADVDTPPSPDAGATLRDARSTIDARLRSLGKPRRSR
jgi:hypothetical protein